MYDTVLGCMWPVVHRLDTPAINFYTEDRAHQGGRL